METFEVEISPIMGEKNSYGYFAGEIYEVMDYTAISYKVVAPKDKAGWVIYHGHSRKI